LGKACYHRGVDGITSIDDLRQAIDADPARRTRVEVHKQAMRQMNRVGDELRELRQADLGLLKQLEGATYHLVAIDTSAVKERLGGLEAKLEEIGSEALRREVDKLMMVKLTYRLVDSILLTDSEKVEAEMEALGYTLQMPLPS
jgi:DNA-binding transcriptional regulator YbjK